MTTEQLADRWFDRREVVNLAGKYITSLLLKHERTLLKDFWASAEDITLGFNGGFYSGREAVSAYYAAVSARTELKSAIISGLFPEQLGGKCEEELYGVGQLKALPITMPVVEIADDGLTAKGIWHVQGADNDITVNGPMTMWNLGFLCIDFIKEEDDWKLWHVLHIDNIVSPMGESWAAPRPHEPAAGFEALAESGLPPFTHARENARIYTPDRPFTAPPRVPEPYETFAETFSYGV